MKRFGTWLNYTNTDFKITGIRVTLANYQGYLSTLTAAGVFALIELVDTYPYRTGGGGLNLAGFTAELDTWVGVDFSPYNTAFLTIDEPHDAPTVNATNVNNINAAYKARWPNVDRYIGTQDEFVLPQLTNLSGYHSQYNGARGPVDSWIADQVGVANTRGIKLILGLNAANGGRTGGVPRPATAEEVLAWATPMQRAADNVMMFNTNYYLAAATSTKAVVNTLNRRTYSTEGGPVMPVKFIDAGDLAENGGSYSFVDAGIKPVRRLNANGIAGARILAGPATPVYVVPDARVSAAKPQLVIDIDDLGESRTIGTRVMAVST